VSHLGCFSDDDRRQQEQILIPKQVDPFGPVQKLTVVERIAVRFPVDLRHVEIGWNAFFEGQAFELRPLHRRVLADTINPMATARLDKANHWTEPSGWPNKRPVLARLPHPPNPSCPIDCWRRREKLR
jgi:hypothetical protein